MKKWIPETDSEWAQLDEYNMARDNNRIPFRYLILFVLAIVVAIKLWVLPLWDAQMDDLYQQQRAMEQACERAGGVVTEDGCRGLRHKP